MMCQNLKKSNTNILSCVGENISVNVETMQDGTPAVRSDTLAVHFNKKHRHVLRDIDHLCTQLPENFIKTNFGLKEREVSVGFGVKKERYYLLTRDAFSLLVMGFTGAVAVTWKLRYIETFNALETTVLQNQTSLARESGYQQGFQEARALPAAEASRKAAYLDGMKEGERLQKKKDALLVTSRAVDYLRKGLTIAEVSILTRCPASTLRGRFRKMRETVSRLQPRMTQGVLA